MSWPVAFVLGAIISPPDAVTARAVAQQLKVPRRIVTVLEGESLVNDATGLVAYRLAITAVMTGSFSFADAGARFVTVAAGGVAFGLLVGWLVAQIHRRIDDFEELCRPYGIVTVQRTGRVALPVLAKAATR